MVPDFLSPSMEHHVRALEMGQCSPGLRKADGDSFFTDERKVRGGDE